MLNDPLARRAVLDFVKADAKCSGGLTPDGAPGCCRPQLLCQVTHLSPGRGMPEFSRTFGLSADLFLGCVVAEMDDSSNGSVDLREFLGARPRCARSVRVGVSPPLCPPLSRHVPVLRQLTRGAQCAPARLCVQHYGRQGLRLRGKGAPIGIHPTHPCGADEESHTQDNLKRFTTLAYQQFASGATVRLPIPLLSNAT